MGVIDVRGTALRSGRLSTSDTKQIPGTVLVLVLVWTMYEYLYISGGLSYGSRARSLRTRYVGQSQTM